MRRRQLLQSGHLPGHQQPIHMWLLQAPNWKSEMSPWAVAHCSSASAHIWWKPMFTPAQMSWMQQVWVDPISLPGLSLPSMIWSAFSQVIGNFIICQYHHYCTCLDCSHARWHHCVHAVVVSQICTVWGTAWP